MDFKKVLVVIPCFNESRAIKHLVQEIRSSYPEMKILVVNDGSTDSTVQEAREGGARVVDLPYNLGIGGTVQTGFIVAYNEGFDVAVQIDGDAQHDPAYLKNVLTPVLEGKLDLCIGSRFLKEKKGYRSTFARRVGIRFFSGLLTLLTGTPLTDPTSGFRAVSRKLLADFVHYYPIDFPEPEAIVIAKRLGARIGEAPVKMRKRLGGTSSIRNFATFYYMLKVTLAILIDTVKKKT